MTCSVCHGRRHIQNKDGKWKRCACVKREMIATRCREAGIPESLWGIPAKQMLKAAFPEMKPLALPVTKPVLWWVRGPAVSQARLYATCYPLKLAAEVGWNALRLRLADLIDEKFRNERDLRLESRNVHVLVVDLDGSDNKLVQHELTDLYQHRANLYGVTVFVSSGDVGIQTGRFGPSMAKVFAMSKAIERFRIGAKR